MQTFFCKYLRLSSEFYFHVVQVITEEFFKKELNMHDSRSRSCNHTYSLFLRGEMLDVECVFELVMTEELLS